MFLCLSLLFWIDLTHSDQMSEEKKTQLNFSDQQLVENARVGYEVASNLWSSRASEVWSQFSAIMTANSIVLAAATLSIGNPASPRIITIGMPVIGLILCILWLILHVRGAGYTIYLALSARELEEKFLSNAVETLSRGGLYGDGTIIRLVIGGSEINLRMSLVGRMISVRWVAYSVIGIFSAMYAGLLITGLN